MRELDSVHVDEREVHAHRQMVQQLPQLRLRGIARAQKRSVGERLCLFLAPGQGPWGAERWERYGRCLPIGEACLAHATWGYE
jgi:hypothetical protein